MGFRISLLTIAAVASSLVAAQVVPASASTPVKAISPAKAGRTTTTPVSNTLLNGKGAPSVTVGIDGDFYIDIASLNMYGPKKNGKWPVPISMKGPAGPTGPTGIDGKIGKEGSPTVGNRNYWTKR